MNALIVATEAAEHTFAGDDLVVIAWSMVGVVLVIAAVTTAVITPRAEHHDH